MPLMPTRAATGLLDAALNDARLERGRYNALGDADRQAACAACKDVADGDGDSVTIPAGFWRKHLIATLENVAAMDKPVEYWLCGWRGTPSCCDVACKVFALTALVCFVCVCVRARDGLFAEPIKRDQPWSAAESSRPHIRLTARRRNSWRFWTAC